VVWLCTDAAAHVSGRDFYIQGDEVALLPEPEAIRTSIHPGGWTLDAFDEAANRDYLFGSIQNRFVKGGLTAPKDRRRRVGPTAHRPAAR